MRSGRHLLIGALLLVGYYAGLPAHLWQSKPEFVVPQPLPAAPAPADPWQFRMASDARTLLVHAASMVELPDGRIRGFWFAGTREGGADVGVHSAVFDPHLNQWSDERRVLDRQWLAKALGRHVRKLGNAVATIDADGKMQLFVVAVSFGGWGSSRIAMLESDDLGATWRDPRLLVTSPFLNISNLVKGAPVRFTDGSLGLPVYHEFLGKFGEVLRLDATGRVLAKQRIGYGRGAIQPVLIVQGPRRATAFLRNEQADHSEGVWRSDTQTVGEQWSALVPAGIPNPSSAIGALTVAPRHWLVAGNCNPAERDDLCLLETRDGGAHWQLLEKFHDRSDVRGIGLDKTALATGVQAEMAATAEVGNPDRVLEHVLRNKCRRGQCEFQYDYPFLLRSSNGDIHMLYTWNKTMIRHAWWQAGGEESR